MEEKKLTDEEIIDSFENLVNTGCCNGWIITDKDVLDFIHRLQYGYSSASKASEEWKAKYEKERKENEEYNQKLYDGELLSKDYHDEQVFHYVDENAELREEIKTLKAELKKELAEHEEFTKKAKAEIERLTEERNKYKGLYETMYRKWSDLQEKEFNCEALRKEKNEYLDKAVELQRQVDEYKDKIEQGTLIEQKTCKNISEMHPVDGFTCSECGISIEDYSEKEVDEENGDITYREYMLRYCPNCGAKVVEE